MLRHEVVNSPIDIITLPTASELQAVFSDGAHPQTA
jgi:hypothetical protein